MRIISGKRRGLKLAPVGKGDPASHLRPTSDRVRESVFNLLVGGVYGNPINGARVLDLFSGTGALGLEAWSRGATQVTFVDDGPKANQIARLNIELCRAEAEVEQKRRDATRLGTCNSKPFDLVFLDPPYGKALGQKALLAACDGGWLASDALVVWEESSFQDEPNGFRALDQRKYGDTYVSILAKKAEKS